MASGRYDPLHDAAPSTSRGGPSSHNRAARRRRARDSKESKTAGPSSSRTADPSIQTSPRPSATRELEESSATFGDDFIAFTPSEHGSSDEKENHEEEIVAEVQDASAEGEKRKGKAREYEAAGRKRKADEIDYDDGYANKKQRMAAQSRRAPWAASVDWDNCRNVAEMLHQEVDAFVKYISPSPVEDEVRGLIVTLISNAVTKAFPDARVLPFGSYQTKLYLPLGDIDLVIESQSMAISNKTAVLQALANTVKRAGITDRVTIIAKAKVPIIKFITTHGRFSVDISFNQVNGVKAGEMVNRFIEELPALRGLVLVTKAFLSQRSMNEVFTGGLGSYSIVCLAISFLQQHPKIRRGEIDPSNNLGVLMMEFFELYGTCFRYDEVGISVRDGGSYYNKAQRGWADYRSPHLLSIEDPGDSSNDISRGSYNISRVRATLEGAFKMLATTAYQRGEQLSARRERRHVRLQETDPEAMSILSCVMGITQETINHRKLVQEVYDKRVLHRMLGLKSSAHAHAPSSKPSSSRAQPNGVGRSREISDGKKSIDEEADMELSSSDIETRRAPEKDEDEREESRYSIKKQPPSKRRRLGTRLDEHTVYTTDEDDEESVGHGRKGDTLIVHADYDQTRSDDPNADHASEDEHDGVSAEEGEYDIGDADDKADKAARKRSYWLSKAVISLDGDG